MTSLIYFYLSLIFIFFSCKHKKIEPTNTNTSGYPDDVSKIMVEKWAIEGCHNSISRSACDGLDFSTWNLMFEGGRNGTSVIPYTVDYSYMLYTVNTDSTRGPTLLPTMPYLRPPLSESEYQLLLNWINHGAQDKDGFVKF